MATIGKLPCGLLDVKITASSLNFSIENEIHVVLPYPGFQTKLLKLMDIHEKVRHLNSFDLREFLDQKYFSRLKLRSPEIVFSSYTIDEASDYPFISHKTEEQGTEEDFGDGG
jgi:hypothetical protein